jgi:hypothetical protein
LAEVIYKLNTLDFSPGIRAKEINENFDLVRRWVSAERLRIGGWGLVEGFELSKDLSDFSINVSNGILINEHGEEIRVDGVKLLAGPPVFYNLTETLTVGDEGKIELKYFTYSNIHKHTIYYDPPAHNEEIFSEEFSIINTVNESHINASNIRFIDENVVILNSDLKNTEVRVNYLWTDDRIDGIFLKKDGTEYIIEIGLPSTSPSEQVVEDYLKNDYYLIGFAYWHIGKEIDVEFITVDKTMRPVFVDDSNNLYLNGILYTGNKFIHFEEPEFPQENDVWFDTKENVLFIFRPDSETGKKKWLPVNDLSRFSREYGIFTEAENPEDLQTFMFDSKENLRFIPNKNQLTIIIDQVVIMRDQYEELYNKAVYDDANNGNGFKLKYPLDRPSVVEVYVDHNVVATNRELDLFAHDGAFVRNDYVIVENEKNTKFSTNNYVFEINNHQLEVWKNGLKLNKEKDFVELTMEGNETSIENNSELSNMFRLVDPIKKGDVISYKITRKMSNYDNLRVVTDSLNAKVDDAVTNLNETADELNEALASTSNVLIEATQKVNSALETVKKLEESSISKEEKVGLSYLTSDVKAKLFANTIYLTKQVAPEIFVSGLNDSDYISVHFANGKERYHLIRNEDYEITNESNGIFISLEADWLMETAEISIEAIHFGM